MNTDKLKDQVEQIIKTKNKIVKLAEHQKELLSQCVEAMCSLEIDLRVKDVNSRFGFSSNVWICAALMAGFVLGSLSCSHLIDLLF